jgi:hypothetical protein
MEGIIRFKYYQQVIYFLWLFTLHLMEFFVGSAKLSIKYLQAKDSTKSILN